MLNLIADLYHGAADLWFVTVPAFLVAFGAMVYLTIRSER